MRELSRRPVAGMVTDPSDGRIGGPGALTYREKAGYAKAMGLKFVNIEPTLANARRAEEEGVVSATRWNGASMERVDVPAQELRAVYNYPEATDEGHTRIIDVLKGGGKRFVNGPETISICDDKERSQALFDELGVRTPISIEYDRKTAAALLSESGFIFVKDTMGTLGDGQVTLSREGLSIAAKVDGQVHTFGCTPKALDFVEQVLGVQGLVVQEGIRVEKVMGRVSDFRAMFQLNGSGELTMPAVFARIGAEGLDQANVSKGGIAMDPYLFHPAFPSLTGEMERVGKEIFKGLQRKAGEVGELGVDYLLSDKGELLVIEMNAKPGTGRSIRDLARDVKRDLSLSLRSDAHELCIEEITHGWKERMATVVSNPVAYLKYLSEMPGESAAVAQAAPAI